MSPAFAAGPGAGIVRMVEAMGITGAGERLTDVGDGRLAAMDTAGIDMQVLSLNAPGVAQLDPTEAIAVARRENDYLAGVVRSHPDRFLGFAALPTPAPEAAADELERSVREHGFKGAMVYGHARGHYLDEPVFGPLLERAARIGVPLYIHPTPPPQAVIDAQYGGLPAELAGVLAGPGWGWHIETGLHVLRLVLSGVFDRLPGLRVIIGHLGEGLPFLLPRFDFAMPASLTKLERPVSAYLRENVYYTISGWTYPAAFLDLLLEVGASRIAFSTDYPFLRMEAGITFLEHLPLSEADKELVAHANAERLLGV